MAKGGVNGCVGRTSGRNRGRSTSAISLSHAAPTAAFSAGDGLLPARPPTYIHTRFATAAPRLAPVLLPAPPARCQPRLPAFGFDHQFRIAVLALEKGADAVRHAAQGAERVGFRLRSLWH